MSQLHKPDVCVCVEDFFREGECNEQQNRKSPEGDVCENAYTTILPKLVSLVSSILVLVWYYKCKQTNRYGTRSSTTNQVVR